MAFHIVTNKCFLACEKVTSVVIEELIPERPIRIKHKKSKRRSLTDSLMKAKKEVSKVQDVVAKQFSITISYYPLANNSAANYNGNTREEYSIEMRIIGKQEAYALYAEIIKEVQEQHPGEGYLDKLVTKMLEGVEFQLEEPELSPNDD